MSGAPKAFAEALIEAGADTPFWHGELMFFLVPRWVVEAYAAARTARQAVTARGLLVAHFGEASVAEFGAHPDIVGWHIGRAWLARMGQLERKARGLPAPAGITEATREEAHG